MGCRHATTKLGRQVSVDETIRFVPFGFRFIFALSITSCRPTARKVLRKSARLCSRLAESGYPIGLLGRLSGHYVYDWIRAAPTARKVLRKSARLCSRLASCQLPPRMIFEITVRRTLLRAHTLWGPLGHAVNRT